MFDSNIYTQLAIPFGIGLIIGIERGWSQRSLPEGARVAGIRTFTLTGFLGGLAAYLGNTLGTPVLLAIASGVLLLVVVSLVTERRRGDDRGITTEIALIITFALGLMAGHGAPGPAVAGAVIVAVVLGTKPSLHHWLETLDRGELLGAFKFLVITLVILPVLPDEGFGPWQALNPYVIWLMVVLVSGISLAGFIATKLVGERSGLLVTGLLGGLSSSTAVAVSMARVARETPRVAPTAAAAAVAGATVLFPRVIVVAGTFAPSLATQLAIPLGATAIASCIALVILWPRKGSTGQGQNVADMLKPFDLGIPLRFGIVLGIVMFATAGLRAWIGDSGLVIASAIAGLTDVDAPTLAAAHAVSNGLATHFGAIAIMAAIGVNIVAKAAIVAWIGGRAMAWRYGLASGATLLAGGIALGLSL